MKPREADGHPEPEITDTIESDDDIETQNNVDLRAERDALLAQLKSI